MPEDLTPNDLMPDGPDENKPPAVSTRGASARLREAAPESSPRSGRMDPASQSLADALRFTYRLLGVGMLGLVALFLFSGFKTIKEGERGIRVILGKPQALNLDRGLRANWPYPIGEMVLIGEAPQEARIGLAFMPFISGQSNDGAMGAPIESFSADDKLRPDRSGSNITADLNLAHTQWTVNYRRENHEAYAANILPSQEDAIVRLAVQRGVVHAMAGLTVDDLLKQSGDSVSARVREIAQRALSEMGSGIEIDRVVMARKSPPTSLLRQFDSVQSAAQSADKQREDKLLLSDQLMNEVAGPAAPVLIDQINEYERLVELGRQDEAEALLVEIDNILSGREAEIGGEVFPAALASGRVTEIIEQATGEVTTLVSRARAERDLFFAKQAQFEANPSVMMSRDWSAAFTEFQSREFVQTMVLPRGVAAELFLNEDPAIRREMERARKRAEAQRSAQERMEAFERDLFRTRRGIQEPDQ